jgi:hypothetical protein
MKERENNMNGVWVATMDSENFTWTAIGLNEDEARNAIAKEWNDGVSNWHRDKMNVEELHEYYGINCRFIEFGKCEWR